MGTPLGPKYIPYTYMDPLGYSVEATTSQCILRRSDFSTRKPHDEEDLAKASGAQDLEGSRTCSRVSGALVWVLVFVVQGFGEVEF